MCNASIKDFSKLNHSMCMCIGKMSQSCAHFVPLSVSTTVSGLHIVWASRRFTLLLCACSSVVFAHGIEFVTFWKTLMLGLLNGALCHHYAPCHLHAEGSFSHAAKSSWLPKNCLHVTKSSPSRKIVSTPQHFLHTASKFSNFSLCCHCESHVIQTESKCTAHWKFLTNVLHIVGTTTQNEGTLVSHTHSHCSWDICFAQKHNIVFFKFIAHWDCAGVKKLGGLQTRQKFWSTTQKERGVPAALRARCHESAY